MDKRRMSYFMIGFVILILVVVLFLFRGTIRREEGITLAQTHADAGTTEGGDDQGGGLNVVQITPATVQLAINTLSRPVTYSRRQTVETFWSGGSGESVSTVAVSGSRVRIDTQLSDGSVRHMLVSGDAAAVWYDEEETWTTLQAERFTADIAQRMPTYESVLALPVTEIERADYRERDGIYCIFVSTRETEEGYADSYWVSVSSGLLVAAERHQNGELIYRFTASAIDADPPEESLFLLPDGNIFYG